MNSGIAWLLVLTAFAASAQDPSGNRLFIGNAAGVGAVNRLAPGSMGQYSVNLDTLPPVFFGGTPTLTLQQPGLPDRSLDVLEPAFLSGLFYVPADTPPGPGIVRFESEGFRVSGNIEIVPTAPALYGVDFSRVLNAQRAPSFEAILLTRPVRPGDTVTVWGTGLGDAAQNDVRATLSGQPLQVQYAGPAPGQRGLDQYNFTIPAPTTLDGSCYSRLEMTVRDAIAPVGFIATSNNDGPCRHPLGLTGTQLATLDKGGVVPVARFSLASQTTGLASTSLLDVDFSALERRESASASTSNMTSATVALASAYISQAASRLECTSSDAGGALGLIGNGQPPADPPPSLGDKVSLAGPSRSFELTKPADTPWFDSVGYYLELPVGGPAPYLEQLPPSAFTPGKWTLSGDGDKSLEAFRIETDIPGPVRFLNAPALRSVDSTRDLTLQWQTEWMRASDTLIVNFIARRDPQPAGVIACTARALDGNLTIPASLMGQLRPSRGQLTLLSIGYLRPPDVTRLPRRDADPVPAILDWTSYTTIPVTLR